MPRIILITRVFPPEVHPTGIMVRELAEQMSRAGWDVQVITGFPNHPEGRVMPGYRRARHTVEHCGDFTLHRTWHLLSPPGRVRRRAGDILTRAASSAACGATLPRADVVALVGLPLVGALAWTPIARLHRSRLVNIVFDLYPDIAFDSGQLRQPLVRSALRLLEAAHWRSADVHVVLSEGFERELLRRGVPPSRIQVIPVWLDAESIVPGPVDNRWRQAQGIAKEQFVVLYAGTIGVVSGAEVAVRAAARLQHRNDILFLMVGEGAAKERAMALAAKLELENLKFLPFQPREQLSEMQSAANVGIVTLAPGRGRTSVPSKVLGYMAAGRPVLAAVDGDSDTAREIGNHGIGRVVPADDDQALAAAVEALAAAPTETDQLGARARQRFESHYTAQRTLGHYQQLFESLLSPTGAVA